MSSFLYRLCLYNFFVTKLFQMIFVLSWIFYLVKSTVPSSLISPAPMYWRRSLKSKPHSSVTSLYAQMIHFKMRSDFTDQFLHFKNNLIFQSIEVIRPWNYPKYVSKDVDWWCHFYFLFKSKIGFWSVNYILITLPSQRCHQSLSFYKGYPRYKF